MSVSSHARGPVPNPKKRSMPLGDLGPRPRAKKPLPELNSDSDNEPDYIPTGNSVSPAVRRHNFPRSKDTISSKPSPKDTLLPKSPLKAAPSAPVKRGAGKSPLSFLPLKNTTPHPTSGGKSKIPSLPLPINDDADDESDSESSSNDSSDSTQLQQTLTLVQGLDELYPNDVFQTSNNNAVLDIRSSCSFVNNQSVTEETQSSAAACALLSQLVSSSQDNTDNLAHLQEAPTPVTAAAAEEAAVPPFEPILSQEIELPKPSLTPNINIESQEIVIPTTTQEAVVNMDVVVDTSPSAEDLDSGLTLFIHSVQQLSLSPVVEPSIALSMANNATIYAAQKIEQLEKTLGMAFVAFLKTQVNEDNFEQHSTVVRTGYALHALVVVFGIIQHLVKADLTNLKNLWSLMVELNAIWSNLMASDQVRAVLVTYYDGMKLVLLRCLPCMALMLDEDVALDVSSIIFEHCPISRQSNESLRRLLRLDSMSRLRDNSVCCWTAKTVTFTVPKPPPSFVNSDLLQFLSLEYQPPADSALSNLVSKWSKHGSYGDLLALLFMQNFTAWNSADHLVTPSRLVQLQSNPTWSPDCTPAAAAAMDVVPVEQDPTTADDALLLKCLPGMPSLLAATSSKESARLVVGNPPRTQFASRVSYVHWYQLERTLRDFTTDSMHVFYDMDYIQTCIV